jgi:ABC-type microcin C transport system duplicated ATPase subunit YejF
MLIAHRLSTVRWADLIYVIEDGRVVESGDWRTLAPKLDGRFRNWLCSAKTTGLSGNAQIATNFKEETENKDHRSMMKYLWSAKLFRMRLAARVVKAFASR